MNMSYTDSRKTGREEPSGISNLFTSALAALLSVGIANAQANLTDGASISADSTNRITKLGPRWCFGGTFGMASTTTRFLAEPFPVYGMKAEVMFPISGQVDWSLAADFGLVPRRVFSDEQSYNTTQGYQTGTFDVSLPASQLAGLSAGMHVYAQARKQRSLIAALSPQLRGLFWRQRVQRIGFHFGLSGGYMIGFHTRVIRTLPESWTANEPVPESAMERREEPYTRWYSTVSPEMGWNFNGRLDLVAGLRFAWLNDVVADSQEETGHIAGVGFFTGLSAVFGRTGRPDQAAVTKVADETGMTEVAKDSARIGLRLAVGGVFAVTEQSNSAMPNISYGIRADALVPVSAHADLTGAGEFLLTPAWTSTGEKRFMGSYHFGQFNHSQSPSAGLRLGMRYYARTKPSIAYASATSKRGERAVWRQRVDRSGFHFGLYAGLMLSWHTRTFGGEREYWTQRHWIVPSPGLGWTFDGRVDLAVNGGYITTFAKDRWDINITEPWVNCCLAVVFGRTGRREF